MESVKFNYKAIELERPGLVLVGGEVGGEVGVYVGDRDARYLFVCVCTGRLYIVMEQCYGECL